MISEFMSIDTSEEALNVCKETLPQEEYDLIKNLLEEKKLQFSFLTSKWYSEDSNPFSTRIHSREIYQLFLYDIADNQIFIRSHILTFLTCPLQYLILLSKIVKDHFPDILYGVNITIYGCEYKDDNSLKIIQGQQVLEDTEIIKKFPWELEEGKYHFYKFEYQYENFDDTIMKISNINISKFSF